MIYINGKEATMADVLKLIMRAYSSMHTQNPVIVKARMQGDNWYYTSNEQFVIKEVK